MAFNTVVQQGRFTADGNNKTIQVRSDIDWMHVYNFSHIANAAGNDGVHFYWQRGMDDDDGIYWYLSGGTTNLDIEDLGTGSQASGGFTLVDSSGNPLTAAVAVTAGTNAVQPVYNTASTAGLAAGDVVILDNLTGQGNLAGFEFQVDNVVANTSFRMAYDIATAPGAAATAGNWRKIKWDPIYYPRRRFISTITAAASAVVTCSVDHGLTVGQKVRLQVPAAFGMVEMDKLQGTITAVTASTLTLNIDSSGFTAFQFPVAGQEPFTFAQVVPLGADTAQAISSSVDMLDDATDNVSYLGMILTAGSDGPGGENGNVMYWQAGKAFSVTNE